MEYHKFRIYCEVEGKYHYVVATNPPSVCPVDNSHAISSIKSIVEENVEFSDGNYTEMSLTDYKHLRFNEIDARSSELIALGYTYGGQQLSLSQNAQLNLLGLNDSRDELTYPIEYNNIDDTDVYWIQDAIDMHSMYMTALGTKKAHLDSGTALKDQIRSSTTKAEVDAVIDNR